MVAGPLIAIVGPTASGKTALAIELAQRFNGEIICADSRTVYKHLDIGTAKPTTAEHSIVPHHLLDVVEPDQAFTVADFKKLANEAITNIIARGKLPILVGGSGLYVDAVLFDYQFLPEGAARDTTNPRHASNDIPKTKSELRKNTLVVGLDVPRETLKQRIINRIDKMLEAGFLDEVNYVVENYPGSKALDAPGYKAFRRYLSCEISLDEAKDLFVRNDYQLAKRQMTWFRRNAAIYWFVKSDEALAFVTKSLIENKNSGKNSVIINTP